MAKVVGFQVKIEGTDSQFKALGELRDSTIRLGEARKILEKQAKTAQGLTAAQTKELGRLTAAQKGTAQSTAELNKEIARSAKAADTAAGSYDSLTQENAQLTAQIRKLGDPLGKNAKQFNALTKRVKTNTATLTKFDKQMGRSQRNVGNYSASIKEGVTNSGLFSRELSIVSRVAGTLAPAFKATTKGVTGTARAMKILKVALISTGIGAIVVALGSLIAAFSGTQRGVDAFTKVFRPVTVIFQKFVGFLENTAFAAFDKLKAAFSDPKQAVIDLGNAIKRNLVSRFVGVVNLFKSGGELISNGFKIMAAKIKLFLADVPLIGELIDVEANEKALKEAQDRMAGGFKDFGNAAIQALTGVENAIDKIADAGKETAEAIALAIAQGKELDRLLKAFEKRQIATVLPLAKARLEFQKLRAIANDLTKTDEQRIAALIEAEKRQRFIAATERELLNLRIKAMVLEQSFNDTSREEQLELARLKEESLNFEAAAQKKINSLISLRSGIQKRQFDRAKKESQKLIDEINELQKTGVKKRIEFEEKELTAAQKRDIARADKKIQDDIDRKKDEVAQLKQFALDTAQNLSDTLFDQRTAQLDREKERELEEAEIKKNLALSAIKDGADAENEILKSKLQKGLITEKQFEDQKAIADANRRKQEEVAQRKALEVTRAIEKDAFNKKKVLDIKQAIINGALAVTQILAQTGILAPIPTAIAVASTAFNVATIASQKFAKGGVLEGASHANGGIPFTVNGVGGFEAEGGETLINKRSSEMFRSELSRINQLGGGVKFQDGGVVPSATTPTSLNISSIAEEVAQSIRVENVATETASVNGEVVNVENIASA